MNGSPAPAPDELLRRCQDEPIHSPGAVQPHGALLVLDGDRVRAAANLELLGGATDDVLGRPLAEVLGPEAAAELTRAPAGEPLTVDLPGVGTVDVVTRPIAQGTLVEIELPSDVDLHERTAIPLLLHSLQQSRSEQELLERSVLAVRELTGFERVMAYRFDEEWNGTVVAESVADGHGTFLGLRYPATDIPPRARALYLRNRVRLIPDSHAAAVPLLTAAEVAGALDLSDASLRAVSPVHLEYLRNMGVRGSASIALLVRGELWGLVACHSYSGPRRPSQRVRITLDVLGGTVSALLTGLITAQDALERVALFEQLDRLSAPLFDEAADPVDALLLDPVADLLDAHGVLLAASGRPVSLTGMLPDGGDLQALLDWLEQQSDDLVAIDDLGLRTPHGLRVDDLAGDAAGLLAVRWGGQGDWLVALRREQVRSIRWGGDPSDKEVVLEPEGARLGPRSSFEEYVETVRGTSAPWMSQQGVAAVELGRRLRDAVASREHRDRSVAALMQRALLLDTVPNVPGADVAITYRPAEGDGLGGDWFDVYFRPDGCAVIALGDVAGHGMGVASTMAQVRHALRAYAMSEPSLGASMARLNELCCTLLPRDMATLLIAVFDAQGGGLEVVNAGHLPPVRTRADGSAELAELARNPALGIARDATFTSTTLELGSGDGVVFFTDGLIERRGDPLDDQLDRLVVAVQAALGGTSRQVCDSLDRGFAPDGSDDVTVLTLRRP